MLQEIQRKIIHFAIDLDIDSVNTYAGYKGDLIVKILTKNKEDVLKIRKYSLGVDAKEVVIKERLDTAQFELYCVTADDSVYTLR
ncbi:MAG: hypothetical protein QG558_1851 [Campylobacterota bacterium]|nr:hypothetical protein [Campylobacterota bacterium]